MYYDNFDRSSNNFYRKFKKKAKTANRLKVVNTAKLEAMKERALDRLDKKRQREEQKEALRLQKIRIKEEYMAMLKEKGYQKGYTPKNPLIRHKRSRNLDLSREIWEKRKDGKSVLELAFEYKIHTSTIMRHVKEYQLYLNLKNSPIDKPTEVLD